MAPRLTPVQANPFVLETGANPTPDQAQTAQALTNYRDPNAPAGDPRNPSYDTPGVTGSDNIVHVDMQGRTHAPLQAVEHNPFAEAHMSTAEDVARTIPGAIAKAGTGLMGLPGDLLNAGGNAEQWLLTHGASAMQDFTGNDLGMPHHPKYEPTNFAHANTMADSGDLNNIVQSATGPYHQPQTWEGRATDTVGQMLPAALGSEAGPLARLLRVLTPAAASEGAGEIARNVDPKSEQLARLLGGVAGGAAQGAGEGIVNAPQIAMSRYMNGYTPDQIGHAMDFMGHQQTANGLSLTPLEALTHTAGGSANQLQHYVENSYTGRPLTQPFFDQRPAQVQGAAARLADAIAPEYAAGPAVLGTQAQQGAEGALQGVRQGINVQATPLYDALRGQEMHPDAYRALAANPSFARALGDFRGQPEISAAYAHLPDNNLSVINEVQKQIDTNARAAAPGELNPGGNHQLESARTSAGDLTGRMARLASDQYGGEYGAARDTVSQGIQQQLEPLRAGPLGELSRTPNVSAQTAALYPARPNVGGTPDLVAALEHLGPDLGGALTRQHILDTADQSTRALQGGENQWSGAALAKALAGSQEQGNRLSAGVGTVAGQQGHDSLESILEGMRATGRRLQTGSGTQFNAERAAALGVSSGPIRTISRLIDPLEYGRHIDSAVGGAMQRQRVTALADMLTGMSPDQAGQFLQGAARRNYGGGQITRLLLDASGSQQ